MNINNILCPVDLSHRSCQALNYAIAFAEQHNAVIHLIHVLPGMSFSMFTHTRQQGGSPLIEGAADYARNRLNQICIEGIPDRLFAKKEIIKHHDQVAGIINYANDNSIDLIVMATHRYGPFKRLLHGSVTERIVRKASCPVFVTKMGQTSMLTCKLEYSTD